MALTLPDMVAKGKRKLAIKGPTMKANYDSAKPAMKDEYGKLPFGPNTKRSYNSGIDAAVYPDFGPEYQDKWARKFEVGAGR